MSEPPRRRGTLSRADLAVALARGGVIAAGQPDAVALHIADQLHLEWIRPIRRKKKPRDEPPLPAIRSTEQNAPRILTDALLEVPFWLLDAREIFPDKATTERPAPAPSI